ncbi:MAG: hypothetical protein Q616_SPPC00188G0001, partial [Streptococcus parasanguinis DORA_23_24]
FIPTFIPSFRIAKDSYENICKYKVTYPQMYGIRCQVLSIQAIL